MQAKTVDMLFGAIKADLLPDENVELVLGMSGESGRILYGAIQTLLRHGRLSRNMLEQAMCYNTTSYKEYITLWIQSLPPKHRSHYTAMLCKDKFRNLPWNTDPNFPNYFRQVGTLGNEDVDSDNHFRRVKPVTPLGDNRHDPLPAKAVRLASEFYNVFSRGLLFDGPDSPSNMNCHDTESLNVLRHHGSLFGIDAGELPWDDGHSFPLRVLPEVMTVSDLMLRTWNVLYHCQRVSLTELENALLQGSVREFMAREVNNAIQLGYQGKPFALRGRTVLNQAINFLNGDYSSLQGETDPANFRLLFTSLPVDEPAGDNETFLECDCCGSMLEKQTRCSRCRIALYCNGDCQKKDWARHKPLCSRFVDA